MSYFKLNQHTRVLEATGDLFLRPSTFELITEPPLSTLEKYGSLVESTFRPTVSLLDLTSLAPGEVVYIKRRFPTKNAGETIELEIPVIATEEAVLELNVGGLLTSQEEEEESGGTSTKSIVSKPAEDTNPLNQTTSSSPTPSNPSGSATTTGSTGYTPPTSSGGSVFTNPDPLDSAATDAEIAYEEYQAQIASGPSGSGLSEYQLLVNSVGGDEYLLDELLNNLDYDSSQFTGY